MGIGDIRYTVLQTVNEVQRRLGLTATSVVGANSQSILLVQFINDVCSELSDYGNWVEALVSANVSAVAGQADYSIATASASVKNIGDIYFVLSGNRTGPLRHVTLEDMRMLTRTSSNSTPRNFTAVGTDNNGNPTIRFHPCIGSAQAGGVFSVNRWDRAPLYTTSDGASVIPFPARVVILGVLAKAILDESGGAPTDRYTRTYQQFLEVRKESFNRFQGDTGYSISFRPSNGFRRGR